MLVFDDVGKDLSEVYLADYLDHASKGHCVGCAEIEIVFDDKGY